MTDQPTSKPGDAVAAVSAADALIDKQHGPSEGLRLLRKTLTDSLKATQVAATQIARQGSGHSKP